MSYSYTCYSAITIITIKRPDRGYCLHEIMQQFPRISYVNISYTKNTTAKRSANKLTNSRKAELARQAKYLAPFSFSLSLSLSLEAFLSESYTSHATRVT